MSDVQALRSVGIYDSAPTQSAAVKLLQESPMVPGSNPQALQNALNRWSPSQNLIQLIISEHKILQSSFDPLMAKSSTQDGIRVTTYDWVK